MNEYFCKKSLIIKNPKIQIKAFDSYLEVCDHRNTVIAYKNISALYINKTTSVKLSTLLKIAAKIPVQIIDHYGYFLSKIQVER